MKHYSKYVDLVLTYYVLEIIDVYLRDNYDDFFWRPFAYRPSLAISLVRLRNLLDWFRDEGHKYTSVYIKGTKSSLYRAVKLGEIENVEEFSSFYDIVQPIANCANNHKWTAEICIRLQSRMYGTTPNNPAEIDAIERRCSRLLTQKLSDFQIHRHSASDLLFDAGG